ncbi:hypothetical protein QUF54_11145, partial [Candidatus Marithioploca araucensis]|nr:hypothetical protein [Candidatus Marithioploca araucensis]
IINALVSALCTGNATKAEELIQLLQKQHPSHPQLLHLQKLLTAKQRFNQPVKDIAHELNELRSLNAPALKLLGNEAQNYRIPLWQRLAKALHGQRFNPLKPELHCSFACSEATDWAGVREAVENEPHWPQHFILALRLCKALYFLNELETAIEIWFYLFWQFPEKAAAAISSAKNPHLRDRWLAFENLEEELNPVHFPIWMLLTDSKLIHYLPKKNLPVSTVHRKNYHTIHQALLLKQKKTESPQNVELELRIAIKKTDEDLLKWYLKRYSESF